MNGERKTDYLIFGAGALGNVIGGRLQETGCSVAYVSRGAPHFRAVMEKGLRITGIWGEHYAPSERIEGFADPFSIIH